MLLSDGRSIDDVIASMRPPVALLPPAEAEEVTRLASIESLLNQLVDAMTSMPAPQVNVEPPDLGDLTRIVNAVTQLRPGATADEIAEAITARMSPQPQADLSVLAGLKDTLEKLDFRLKGVGGNSQAFGGTSRQDITSDAARQLGVVSITGDVSTVETPVATATATYSTSGPHTLLSPAAGNSLAMTWLYLQAKGALDTGTVEVTVTLGSESYTVELTGSQAFAHSTFWQGAVNESVVVTTSSAAAVIVAVDYREA